MKLIARERAAIEKEWEVKKSKINEEAERLRQQQELIRSKINEIVKAKQEKMKNSKNSNYDESYVQ